MNTERTDPTDLAGQMSEARSAPASADDRRHLAELEKANAKLRLQLHYQSEQYARLVADTAAMKREVHEAIAELGCVARERAQFEAEIRASKDYYQSLFEGSPTAYWLQDWSAVKNYFDDCRAAGTQDFQRHFNEHPREVTRLLHLVKIVRVNEAAKKLYRAAVKSDLLQGLGTFKPELADRDFFKQLVAFARGETLYESETQNLTLTGEVIHIALRKAVIPGFEHDLSRVMAALTDITARKRAVDRLHASLREKEILLREIHHRVKNNLQLISGLLDLSAHHTNGADPIALLEDARGRIYTMGLVHTQLYNSNRFDAVPMEQHIRELAQYLAQTHARPDRQVTVTVTPSAVELTVNQAIPCALAINELISNAFKHAFSDRTSGLIRVAIEPDSERRIHARVSDNGSGLPAHIDFDQPRTLGLQLVVNLVRRQLKGTVQVTREGGTAVAMSFPLGGA